jgi:hypothetical protein
MDVTSIRRRIMVTFVSSAICLLLGYYLGFWYRGEKDGKND